MRSKMTITIKRRSQSGWLVWLDVVVSLYQFFVMQLDGDYLGGIFGVEKGGNVYTNIFFVIVVTKSVLSYLEKKRRFVEMRIPIGGSASGCGIGGTEVLFC